MLASIQKITNLSPIEGADNIEVADVLGWKVVVKKEQFKVGDLSFYIQIDTIVPEISFFEFLKTKNYRIKTIKLRKQISQGLVISKDEGCIVNGQFENKEILNWKEGNDATSFLGIKKYSKEVIIPEEKIPIPKIWYKKLWHYTKYKYLVKIFPNLKITNKLPFPTQEVHKTDEERIQNIPWVLQKNKGDLFTVSEKLDGSSITIIHKQEKSFFEKKKSIYRICSRNFELLNKTNEWYKVFEETNFKAYIDNLVCYLGTPNIIVQGEYIGKPQGNPYKLDKSEIRLFNIFVDGKILSPIQFSEICSMFSIPRCPLLASIILPDSISELLLYAENKSTLCSTTEREGVVMRSIDGNISFKVISNKFLLKNNE